MSVHCHQTRAVADITENVPIGSISTLSKPTFSISSLIDVLRVFRRSFRWGSQPYRAGASHVRLVIFCFFKNQFEWNILAIIFLQIFYSPFCREQFQRVIKVLQRVCLPRQLRGSASVCVAFSADNQHYGIFVQRQFSIRL